MRRCDKTLRRACDALAVTAMMPLSPGPRKVPRRVASDDGSVRPFNVFPHRATSPPWVFPLFWLSSTWVGLPRGTFGPLTPDTTHPPHPQT
jgi:hypothetical protein